MSNFINKTALITGASRGIGKAVALELARNGAHVILLARSQADLEELDDQIRADGGQATLIPLDLRKLDKVDLLGPSILEQFGGLDILVGNAGVLGTLGSAHQFNIRDMQKVMTVNFEANARLIRTLDPLLRASTAGRIVFTTAGNYTVDGLAYWGTYMASKAALNAFIKTYALETRRTNIKINGLYPGPTQTALLNEAFPGGTTFPVKQPEDVAPAILQLCVADCTQHGEIVEVTSLRSA